MVPLPCRVKILLFVTTSLLSRVQSILPENSQQASNIPIPISTLMHSTYSPSAHYVHRSQNAISKVQLWNVPPLLKPKMYLMWDMGAGYSVKWELWGKSTQGYKCLKITPISCHFPIRHPTPFSLFTLAVLNLFWYLNTSYYVFFLEVSSMPLLLTGWLIYIHGPYLTWLTARLNQSDSMASYLFPWASNSVINT